MSMDGVNKGFGVFKLGFDSTQSMPQTNFQKFSLLKDVGFGLGGIFGGPMGSALSAQNDLGNFVKSGFEQDKTTRNIGMMNSGVSYFSSMLSMFPKTTPMGMMVGVQQLSFNVALQTEMRNPGAWENFKQDPMFHNAMVGQY